MILFCVMSVLVLLAQVPRTNDDRQLIITESPLAIREIDKWQTGPYCGVNCIYLLLALKGMPQPLELMRNEVPVTDEGASLLDLKEVAAKHGLDLDVFKLTPSDLGEETLPIVALMNSADFSAGKHEVKQSGHYVVLLRVEHAGESDETVTLIDGTSAKLLHMSGSAFNRAFSGFALAAVSSGWARHVNRLLTAVAVAEGLIVLWYSVLLLRRVLKRYG